MKLIEIATNIVGSEKAAEYLLFELPDEDHEREFTLDRVGDDFELYRDSDVYLLHYSTGLDTGYWDDLSSDYPLIAATTYETEWNAAQFDADLAESDE